MPTFLERIKARRFSAASSSAVSIGVNGESESRLDVDAGGKLLWGSGSATGDTNLYRSAADTLKTDDAFTAASLAVTGQFTLPTADGTSNQVLVTNGSGTVSWANQTGGSGSPGGSDGQVQYNNGGAFGGASSLYYDDVNLRVGIGTTSPAEELHILKDQNGDLTQVLIENLDQRVRIGSYYEAGVAQYGKIQSEQDAGGNVALALNPEGGNVGIGTASPAEPVHVVTASGDAYLRQDNGTATTYLGPDGSNTGLFGTSTAHDVRFITSNTERVRIDTSGNVGIGITSPQAPLSFANGVGGKIDLFHDTTHSGGAGDRYGLEIQSSELRIHSGAGGAGSGGITFGKKTTSTFTESMRITNDGNVGIGTTSPSDALDLAGGSIGLGQDSSGNAVGGPFGIKVYSAATTGNPASLESALYYRTSPNSWSFEDGSANKIVEFDADDLLTTFGGNVEINGTGLNLKGTGNYPNAVNFYTSGTEGYFWHLTGPRELESHSLKLYWYDGSSYSETVEFATGGAMTVGGSITTSGDIFGTSDTNFFIGNDSNERILFQESSNQVYFYVNGVYRAYFTSGGNFVPYADSSYSLGTSSLRWTHMYSDALTTGTAAVTLLNHSGTSSYDKIRVWNSSSYAIGMKSGITFGPLGDYAMTFRMNSDNDRGFWWGDTAHGVDGGAMALSTNGNLYVANSVKVGFGETNTSNTYSYDLQVNTDIRLNNLTLTSVDADGSMRIQGSGGYIDLGPKNTSYAHIYTDRGAFYMNKDLHLGGTSSSEGGEITLENATGYSLDWNIDNYQNILRMFNSSLNNQDVRIMYLNTTTGNNTIRWNSNGSLLRYSSLTELKEDIEDIDGILGYLNERNPIYDLTPKIFHERDGVDADGEATNTTRGEYIYGLLAEDVYEVLPEICNTDGKGALSGYGIESLIPLLVAEIQRLGGMVETLYQAHDADYTSPTPRPASRADAEKVVFQSAIPGERAAYNAMRDYIIAKYDGMEGREHIDLPPELPEL